MNMIIVTDCPKCKGLGNLWSDEYPLWEGPLYKRCEVCQGTGKVNGK